MADEEARLAAWRKQLEQEEDDDIFADPSPGYAAAYASAPDVDDESSDDDAPPASAHGQRGRGAGAGQRSPESAPSKGASSHMDPRDAKIISLSKKNRNLVMALGKERANIAKLAQEVQVLKQRLKSSEAGASREDGGARTGEDGGRDGRLAEEARELREKYAGANTKLNEMRVAQQQLREELRRTQRALQREVGDDVPLQKVIDEGSSWRGRAQEISLLKTKVKELKRQLEQAEAGSPRSPSGEGASGTGAVRAGTSKRSFDDVHRADLDRREADRRAEQERLLLEGRAAAEENSALRKRGEASAARIKALENEVKALKQKLLVVLDKTANDDRLIATLKAELEGARGGGATGSSQPRRPRGSSSRGTPDAELDSLRKVAREQEAQLDRQEQIILSLRDQLQRAMERLREKGQGGGVGSSGTRPESAMRSMQVENERLVPSPSQAASGAP